MIPADANAVAGAHLGLQGHGGAVPVGPGHYPTIPLILAVAKGVIFHKHGQSNGGIYIPCWQIAFAPCLLCLGEDCHCSIVGTWVAWRDGGRLRRHNGHTITASKHRPLCYRLYGLLPIGEGDASGGLAGVLVAVSAGRDRLGLGHGDGS